MTSLYCQRQGRPGGLFVEQMAYRDLTAGRLHLMPQKEKTAAAKICDCKGSPGPEQQHSESPTDRARTINIPVVLTREQPLPLSKCGNHEVASLRLVQGRQTPVLEGRSVCRHVWFPINQQPIKALLFYSE